MLNTYGKTFFIAAGLSLMLASTALAVTAEQYTYARFVRVGMKQLKAGDHQAARDSFEKALRYINDDADAHLGLGVACFYLQDDSAAERELMKAAEIDPKRPGAYQFLGELFYREDDLETAATYWEKAVELNPSAKGLRARLDRIRKEQLTEKEFNRDVTIHFLVKYDGRENIEAGRIILGILEDAYGEIGRSLSYYPDQEIQVILYSRRQFREVTDAPGWSGGIYDGKIRIPIGGIDRETPGLRKLLYHEYTHAVVLAVTPRCPTWLNEGLAQYFEGRKIDARQKEALKHIAQEGKLPSLSSLEGPFTELNGKQARFAYLLSLSAVNYLIDTIGLYRVEDILNDLAAGADAGKAISKEGLLTYEEFDDGWKQSLQQ